MKLVSLCSFILTSKRNACHLIPKTTFVTLCSISTSSPTTSEPLLSGLCAVYKPRGWTSSDVVQKVRVVLENQHRTPHIKKPKIKVGHGGTLDPLAEGVLVLGIGDGTKLMNEYLTGSKEYFATGILGEEMDTLDSLGVVTETKDCSKITIDQLNAALSSFRGDILQIPPMYSALKKDGQTLYKLARAGIEVEREPRPVTVYKLSIAGKDSHDGQAAVELPRFTLNVECSGGFYVRSLISDLARSVDGVAHMTALVRTKQGCFRVADCLPVEKWAYAHIREQVLRSSESAGLNVSTLRPAFHVRRAA